MSLTQLDRKEIGDARVAASAIAGTAETDATLLEVSGRIDIENSHLFAAFVDRLIDEGCHHLVFDLEGVSYMSSTGIAAMLTFVKRLRPSGGRVLLARVRGAVRQVFELLGFAAFCEFVDEVDDAAAMISRENQSSVFPRIEACPVCSRRVRLVRPGRFRCTRCSAIVRVAADGSIGLG